MKQEENNEGSFSFHLLQRGNPSPTHLKFAALNTPFLLLVGL